jgi:hypothetical protein
VQCIRTRVVSQGSTSNIQEQPRKNGVTVHYRGIDICRSYLCARHALYEECPRVTWTQGQAPFGAEDDTTNIRSAKQDKI